MSYIGNPLITAAFLTDQFSGNGSTTTFTMSVAPANTASVLVSITGVLQDPSTYSVSGTTLTFSAAPPTGTGNISVRYLGIPASGVTTTAYRTVTEFTATAGQTTFTPPSYTAGFINVYRNGVLLGSADYTASNGTTVVLATGATAGDLVATESFYVSSVLNAIPATAGAVNSTYIAAGAVGTTQLTDANVTSAKLTGDAIPIGVNQTWQNVTSSRASGTTYTNSTGRPIMVLVTTNNNSNTVCNVAGTQITNGGNSPSYTNATFIVPNGSTYSVTAGSGITYWAELR